MKNYVKPNLNLTDISLNTNIATLNEWLSANELNESSITTYEYQS